VKTIDPLIVHRALERLFQELPSARSRYVQLVREERRARELEWPRDENLQRHLAELHDPGVY